MAGRGIPNCYVFFSTVAIYFTPHPPYAILSGSIPARKMGVYMGIFNFFITFPQIVNGFFGGYLVKYAFGGQPIYSIMMAGVLLLVAAALVLRVKTAR